MRLYRRVRQRVRELLAEVQEAGLAAIYLDGEGDIADICRLTCLEMGIKISTEPLYPALKVQGTRVQLQWEPAMQAKLDGREE